MKIGLRNKEGYNMKRYLITGGTGSLGRTLTKLILETEKDSMVVIYSRDEGKQARYFKNMRNVKCVLGDVRDKEKFKNTLINESITHVIHAGALKRIDDMELAPDECMKTNIMGSNNVAESITEVNNTKALEGEDIKGILISTDKACLPINAYGSSKHFAEKIFLKHGLRVIRYGNVIASRGSFIPIWREMISNGQKIKVTDKTCTRYLFTLLDAGLFVLNALNSFEFYGPFTLIPKLDSYYITDVMNVLYDLEGKQFNKDKVEVIGLRPGEKLHEDMLSENELAESYMIADAPEDSFLKSDNCVIIRPSIWNNKTLYEAKEDFTKYTGDRLNSLSDSIIDNNRLLKLINEGLKC